MKTLMILVVALAIPTPSALAVCGIPGPVIPPDGSRPPPTQPPDSGPPPSETPPDDTTPPPGTGPEETPGEPPDQAPPPKIPPIQPPVKPPSPVPQPAPPPGGAQVPGGAGRAPGGSATPRPGPAVSFANAWSLWWELNREHLLGLRKTLPAKDIATAGGVDPTNRIRAKALPVLRKIALGNGPAGLRAAALRALGRAGDDTDARSFLALLRSREQPTEVLEGAAIGLASLARISDEGLRAELRTFFEELLEGKSNLPERARQLGILAVSLRARDDRALARSLGVRCARPVSSSNEAAALLLACGLARDELLAPELSGAVVTGKLSGRTLHDVARSHAVLGLALTRKPGAVKALAAILVDGKAQAHTRRSAVVGLGLLLRTEITDEKLAATARKSLMQTFARSRDPITMGFAAMGMGTAHTPFGIPMLEKAVDKTGHAVVRPYAAVALGIAALRLPEKEGDRIRRFLVRELAKTRHVHLAGALSIAAGVSGAKEALPVLLERAGESRLYTGIRAYALEALGLLGDDSEPVMTLLRSSLEEGSPLVVRNSAVALGFLGNRQDAKRLVEKLAEAPWEAVQKHMVVGLSHLGGTVAVEPLLALLRDPSERPATRRAAANAIGILLDPRERDPLFEIDACCNPYALTFATRELVSTY